MNGLILGRFQVFHKGHESLVNQALSVCDKVLILVGSSDKSKTKDNPFTYETREKLIKEIFQHKVIVAPLPDLGVGDVNAWGDYVLENAKKYIDSIDIIFLGKEPKHELWYSEEIRKNTRFISLDRADIPVSSTLVREAILNNDKEFFFKYTNPKIHKYFEELKEELKRVQ